MRFRDYKTPGIVLSKRRQGDSDYFVDIFSPQEGKFTAIAKGALKITSNHIGKLEIGQEALFEIHISSQGYHLIKGIEIHAHNIININSVDEFLCISKLVELLKKFEFEEEVSYKLFQILSESLKIRQQVNPYHLVSFIKISILDMLGFIPDCRICSGCSQNINEESCNYSHLGEISCSTCNEKISDLYREISLNQLKIINFIKLSSGNIREICRLKISQQDQKALENYALTVLENAVNVKLKCTN